MAAARGILASADGTAHLNKFNPPCASPGASYQGRKEPMNNLKGCCPDPKPRKSGLIIEDPLTGKTLSDQTTRKCENCGHIIESNEEFKRLQMIEAWNDSRENLGHKRGT